MAMTHSEWGIFHREAASCEKEYGNTHTPRAALKLVIVVFKLFKTASNSRHKNSTTNRIVQCFKYFFHICFKLKLPFHLSLHNICHSIIHFTIIKNQEEFNDFRF
jgi:hypothetical protein